MRIVGKETQRGIIYLFGEEKTVCQTVISQKFIARDSRKKGKKAIYMYIISSQRGDTN